MSFLDAAPRWFACFDQPDLKSSYEIRVRAPAGLDGARQRPEPRSSARVAGGSCSRPAAVHLLRDPGGRAVRLGARRARRHPLGLHVRASLARAAGERGGGHVRRDQAVPSTTTTGLFGVRYPFGEYHQAFVPDFNAGAMENPGCVTFRDTFVFRGRGDPMPSARPGPGSSRTRWRTCGSATWSRCAGGTTCG